MAQIIPCQLDIFTGEPTKVSSKVAREADIIYNTTSIGQTSTEEEGKSPMSRAMVQLLKPDAAIDDAVYMPIETPLLSIARTRGGLLLVDGTEMLLHQAVEQVRIFTGKDDVPVAIMREALRAEVLRRQAAA
ncbi:hypothetical protein IPL68_01410 [Candidatus Saccharibacteria bacterium]|nr:MAG: hypothetical protein IPL68_01410 [Candidatus Saccharibacteria bacterium]